MEGKILISDKCEWSGPRSEAFHDPDDDTYHCPHCISICTQECPGESFWDAVDRFEAGEYTVIASDREAVKHPGYRAMIEWGLNEMRQRGKCYTCLRHMANSYRKHNGVDVVIAASVVKN